LGAIPVGENLEGRTLRCLRMAPASAVPATAVIRRIQALSGMIGRKASAGGSESAVKGRGSTPNRQWKLTAEWRGREFQCSGEMRSWEEHRWRSSGRRALMDESWGANGIRYPSSPSKRWILGVARIDPTVPLTR